MEGSAINDFKGKRIAIIGDAVADQFLSGTITRVSREAPVFIMRHDETVTLPGAAANAAANVAALGGRPILAAIIGNDAAGDLLISELERMGVSTGSIVRTSEVRTTTKTRVLAGHQHAPKNQVIRIDHEPSGSMPNSVRDEYLSRVSNALENADAVIFSDYGYGAADEHAFEFCREVTAKSGVPLIVDSRFRLSVFRGAFSATPNQEEAEAAIGGPIDDESCMELLEKFGHRALLVTCGGRGMRLYEAGEECKVMPAVGSTEPVDVTGAGDTVIAAFALGLASGLDIADSASIANHAGGIVVMKKRTAVASADELAASLDREAARAFHRP